MTADGDGGRVRDRDLVEDAVKLLLTEAPPGWQQLHGEFEPSSQPVVAQAFVTTADGRQLPSSVSAGAISVLAEHQRRAAAAGAPWQRLVIDCAADGRLSARAEPAAAVSAPPRPPDGFRWVEPETGEQSANEAPSQPSSDAAPRPSRRGRWIAATVGAVTVLVVSLVAVVWWHPWSGERGGTAPGAGTAPPAPPPTGTPKELLVSFPLNRQPVPGWRVRATDIGLPPHVPVGDLFASSGQKAYFVTAHCDDGPCSNPMGWVYGLDTGSGKRLFAPVALTGFYGGASDCYSNGPSVAVCLTEGYRKERPQLVWVIDLDRGAVTFTGRTELYPQEQYGPGPRIRAVGNYRGETRLVAAVKGKGVYGVGPQAELTWFVPGDGEVVLPNYLRVGDIPPLTVALQRRTASDRSGPKDRVFSVIDGKDLTPNPAAGITIDRAAVYNGGFAYHYQEGVSGGVLFYDTRGREVARQEVGFASPMQDAATPIFVVNPESRPEWMVYTAGGKLLARIPGESVASEFQTIGTKLYVRRSLIGPDESWQQWDLPTGRSGPTCKMHLGVAYVASDGNIILTQDTAKNVAIDASTCQTLWETPSEPDDSRVVIWKVDNGLLQRTRKSDTIVSLRAPE
ncbi:hypothetical protein A5791_20580 [Mycobacterium sp. 852002-51163_SCH5372311]|uniref:hypothetical protein n=1 Tax=Mycobacterium sp. 852002-51163_SCH5372311 TaxID=1834097 RepID=UPI0008021A0F|nr:hypothetical protein [Mycobacterium sp. 852002-51163_SCH5372311]OBF86671.1 hypothetical protein A5791_20580 [Mycobacterium sp. 852002-51163_SCH5372311]